ncbi:hypothetical protein [Marinagarivorans cellulosilyticus]|uniref:Uncharacterized protein n=1 Tax=Marinagarivorans cellulosilyticus TaxID=2721545 RepID=A0AAN1WFF7_9GAMM|nr:hypothetical protein [Marinagarivorans cellulosilyticus]BCD96598.1 hypothetical protein MARGE09_P0798 [Marinagarivorans cellulosilyticus]
MRVDDSSSDIESIDNPSAIKRFRLFTVRKAFTLTVFALLIVGWRLRSEYLISAEYGLGYALGIVGASLMLLLLIYPLRKRLNRNPWLVFSTKTWFKMHMVMGILGPLAILYHCNFALGSTNSNITLAAMGLMVGSGLVGRFIYSRIHYSLYGKKMVISQLFADRQKMHDQLDADGLPDDILLNNLYVFEKKVLARRGVLGNLTNFFVLRITSWWTLISLTKKLKKMAKSPNYLQGLNRNQRREYFYVTRAHIQSYLITLRKIAGLSFYERLFSMWHMLHLPIFVMLIITAVAHVYAVHVY